MKFLPQSPPPPPPSPLEITGAASCEARLKKRTSGGKLERSKREEGGKKTPNWSTAGS